LIKIGVISDTHLSCPTEELEDLMDGPFKEVDMILHAGDMTELKVLDSFSGKKVVAVCGNMDSSTVRKEFPAHRVFDAGSFKIGLIHGWGGPRGIEERIAREFGAVDCIVYGHTHHPSRGEREGVFFFNPGAFGGGLGSNPKSVGVLTLGEAIAAEIIYL
jgi:putative phosphoesterase